MRVSRSATTVARRPTPSRPASARGRSAPTGAAARDVELLSLYAFSRENWSRSEDEVRTLFALLESAIRDETPELVRQGVRGRILGRLDELPEAPRTSIREALAATEGGRRLTLNVAFNYSGRSEIVDAVRRCMADGLGPETIRSEERR